VGTTGLAHLYKLQVSLGEICNELFNYYTSASGYIDDKHAILHHIELRIGEQVSR